MVEKQFAVEGMSCGHCAASVKSLLSEIEGVEKINVDLDNSSVNLRFKEDKINEILLKRMFNKNGSYTLK